MFTPRNKSVRAGQSPFTFTPQGSRSAQSRRVANVFTPTRGRQKAQQNKSALQTSQVLEETSNFLVEKFGLPLPVLITEALTFADRNTKISVKIDESGWAWLVGGRKLFVWRYKQAYTGRNILCKELTLPPSDLAHSAARVCVIPSSGDGQSASCIAVSPEGVVRYWSNVAFEASSMEISAELKGDECDCVVNLAPFGCLLATTTSSLVIIAAVPGQNTVSCHPLKATQGIFGGISRRMSSLIFGGGQGQTVGAPLQAVIAGKHEEDERPFYVLSGTHLHKWVVGDYSMEKFLYQIDADRLFRESLARKVWDKDSIQMTQLTTWLLDMHLSSEGVVLLGAGVDAEVEPLVHYALATIATDAPGTPSRLESFRLLQFTKRYQEENEAEMLGYRLLIPDDRKETVYLYNDFSIIMDMGTGENAEELSAPGGRLLGAGTCDDTAVFFSITQGLISVASNVKQNASILDVTAQELVSRSDMTQLATSSSQIHELSMSDDKSARLKAAFLSACSGNLKQAQEIVNDLFPEDIVPAGNQTTDIDRLVSGLSRDLIDDYPASDPRWAENARADSGSSTTSLIILQQLKDKQKAHEYIINFLKKLGLWDKLRVIKVGDHLTSTKLLLCQHAEKLEAAIALREMHSDYTAVIDSAMRKVLSSRGEHTGMGLSPQDIFYREVSRIQDIFEALLDYEGDIMAGSFTPADIIAIVAAVNSVFQGMLHAALLYRETKADIFHAGPILMTQPEYIPWTSSLGTSGLRTLIHKQFMLTLDSAIPEVRDTEIRGQLFQHMLSLANYILDGYSVQLASLSDNPDMVEYMTQLEDHFTKERTALIVPFLDYEQYELAASLAEKYCDFEILIRICEKTGNQERIQRYQQQFTDKGFSDFLFSWYMKEGKQGRLLSLPTQQQSQLNRFLQKDEFGYLKWLHDIECRDFKSAHETLLNLGRNEEEFLAKKKTLLSLAKLAALASREADEQLQTNIRDIDEEQELILNQELLPMELLEKMNMDPEYMKVLSPVELIQLYTCDQNTSATEYDFKKALDLMQFLDMEDPAIDYEDIRTNIWCKAILRDEAAWKHKPTGDPLDSVRDTIFFKTVSLAITDGLEPKSFLPDLQTVLSSEILGTLSTDRQFQYLLGAIYELAHSTAP